MNSSKAQEAAERVKLAVFDVDGVLTDGGLFYSGDGESLKRFDVRDGLGLKLLQAAGIEVAIITARDSVPLRRRLSDLGIRHFVPNCSAKLSALSRLASELGVHLSQVAYTGDDLIDLPALRAVGCPIAVANAHHLLKEHALWTATRTGGDGAVREIAESLISSQRDLGAFVGEYLDERTRPPTGSGSNDPQRTAEGFSVVIPARFNSSRLPGKPLLPLAGRPMIQHVYENALRAGANEVIVATDDHRIYEAVRGFGGTVTLTSEHHDSGTERIAEVAKKENWPTDQIVVNLQGDEPLLGEEHLKAVAQLLRSHPEAGLSTLATPIDTLADLMDPNVVKVVLETSGLARYFSRAPIPWVRDAFSSKQPTDLPSGVRFLRHLGLYAYRVGTLERLSSAAKSELEKAEALEQLRALSLGIPIAVETLSNAPGHGVDTPADLKRVTQEIADRLQTEASGSD